MAGNNPSVGAPLIGLSAATLATVVLLDLNLPRFGGLDVLKRVRADDRTRLLPVVVLTSSDEEKDIVGSYDLGANSYVRKPTDFQEFLTAVAELGLCWSVRNTPPPQTR